MPRHETITVRNWTPAERARLFGNEGIIDEGRRRGSLEQTTVRVPATPTYLGGIVSSLNSETE